MNVVTHSPPLLSPRSPTASMTGSRPGAARRRLASVRSRWSRRPLVRQRNEGGVRSSVVRARLPQQTLHLAGDRVRRIDNGDVLARHALHLRAQEGEMRAAEDQHVHLVSEERIDEAAHQRLPLRARRIAELNEVRRLRRRHPSHVDVARELGDEVLQHTALQRAFRCQNADAVAARRGARRFNGGHHADKGDGGEAEPQVFQRRAAGRVAGDDDELGAAVQQQPRGGPCELKHRVRRFGAVGEVRRISEVEDGLVRKESANGCRDGKAAHS